ncbi:(2Fe-2S)-binding protein [Salipaludibacillus sp. CF4.18]|uniref:(2Fe-2S)-binding protein n=1 Tax=Salipaludibacillus sp. CF4.18 TaxID=3373081 RepID=UPI003EE68288
MIFLDEVAEAEQQKLLGVHSGEIKEGLLFSINTASFRTHEGVSSYLKWYAEEVNAPSYDVVGTFWASRMGRYVALIHWCIARGVKFEHDWDIDISYVNNEKGKEPSIHYMVGDSMMEVVHDGDKVAQLHDFYQYYLSPMVHEVANACELRSSMLWGQLVHTIPFFLKQVSGHESDEFAANLMTDWDHMKNNAPAEVFAERKNPFPYRSLEIPNPKNKNEPMHTKSSCCLYFKLSGNYCYSCPRMKPAERQERYEKLKLKNK